MYYKVSVLVLNDFFLNLQPPRVVMWQDFDPFASFSEPSSTPAIQSMQPQASPTQQATAKEEDDIFASFDDQPTKPAEVHTSMHMC